MLAPKRCRASRSSPTSTSSRSTASSTPRKPRSWKSEGMSDDLLQRLKVHGSVPAHIAIIMDGNGRWAGGRDLALNICISYSSRAEIARAARQLAEDAAAGRLDPAEIDEEAVARRLYTAPWPDPDLLIRTSGEMRISNFLLWQLAYAELYVTPVLWPDFTRRHLFEAILEFQRRDRRFGRVSV